MKTIITQIIIGLVLVIGIAVLFNQLQNEKMWRKQFEENMNQMLNENNQKIILQNEKQFAKLYPKLDSIASANNIQNISEITNVNYSYGIDSIITILIRDTINLSDSTFSFVLDTLCLTMNGIVSIKNNAENMLINSLKYKDEFQMFEHWERQRLFGWKWTPRWSRKKDVTITVISECTDTIKTEKIIIGK